MVTNLNKILITIILYISEILTFCGTRITLKIIFEPRSLRVYELKKKVHEYTYTYTYFHILVLVYSWTP